MHVINVVIVIFIFLKLLLLFVNCIDYFGITDMKDTYYEVNTYIQIYKQCNLQKIPDEIKHAKCLFLCVYRVLLLVTKILSN